MRAFLPLLVLLATVLFPLARAKGTVPASDAPRGTSRRCGVNADKLPDIGAMVPCWKGTVNVNGDPIDNARSGSATYTDTYSTAPAPALSYHGYWVPTPNSGPKGELGCVFYEYITDMQVAGRWQATCPAPGVASGGNGLVTALWIAGFCVLPFVLLCCVPRCLIWIRTTWRNRSWPRLPSFALPSSSSSSPGQTTRQPPSSQQQHQKKASDWAFVPVPSVPHLQVNDPTGRRIAVVGNPTAAAAAAADPLIDTRALTTLPAGTITTTRALQPPPLTVAAPSLQYFEVHVGERSAQTLIRVGLAPKPFAADAPLGTLPRSVAVDCSSGEVWVGNRVRGKVTLPPRISTGKCPAVCVGFGVRQTVDASMIVTVDGAVVWEGERPDPILFPAIGASGTIAAGGTSVVSANFGHASFLWETANVERGGLERM